jgi:glycosyltransferase involved in cell wall biosynthesis
MSKTFQGSLPDPLVSVIIPAYNAETFIERTLTSVLNQTYRNIEVIVVDDGSHDRTAEIVKALAQKDDRVHLIQQANAGVAAARNLAIQISRGAFIAPIDADDLWFSDYLEKQVQCLLQSDDSIGIAYTWSIDIDEQDEPTGTCHAYTIEGEVFATLLCHDFVGNASSVLIRRTCLEHVGNYNCQLKEQQAQGGEDLDLYLRIAEKYQFRAVPEFLAAYRRHSASMSCDYKAMAKSRLVIWESIRQKYPKVPAILYSLSNSSFYLYIARQSSSYGSHEGTLFWLYQAVRVDHISPFVRPGFYLLIIKSILSLAFQPLIAYRSTPPPDLPYSTQAAVPKSQLFFPTFDLNQHSISIQVKILIGNLLHQLISRLFGSLETWKASISLNSEEAALPVPLPLVSVIIPAYNAEAFIEKTLRSVMAQTYQNLEVIVVDDGSQDGTAAIVQSIAQEDHRIHFFHQANAGVAAARNLAIQKAHGELIAPIDADDIWFPQNLEKQVRCITTDAGIGFVYSWSVEIDESDQLSGGFHASYQQGEVYLALLNQNFIGNASAVLLRRECLNQVGGYNSTLRAQGAQGSEDWDLYLRLSERYSVGVVPEFLVGYRQITTSMSRNRSSMAKSQSLVVEAAKQRHPEIPETIYRWSLSRFYLYLARQSYRSSDIKEVLYWLYKAYKLDIVMTLLRHDFYALFIKSSLRKISLQPYPFLHLTSRGSSRSDASKITIKHINRMVSIRKFLPSSLYEHRRLKALRFEINQGVVPKIDYEPSKNTVLTEESDRDITITSIREQSIS